MPDDATLFIIVLAGAAMAILGLLVGLLLSRGL